MEEFTGEFFEFNEMLPEHKEVLMRQLVSSGSPCTAIMLASTCKQERLRYKQLGYKWPFAAARLSAARNGYYSLFKWLFAQCKPYRFTDRGYMTETWHAVCATSNLELFKWYAGPGYFSYLQDLSSLSWPVFSGVFGEYLDRQQWSDVLAHIQTAQWGLQPFHYLQKRFGSEYLVEEHLCTSVLRVLGQRGTLDDINALELGYFFAEGSETFFVAITAISKGNYRILNDLFETWPAVTKRSIAQLQDHLYPCEQRLAHCDDVSISLLETCKRIGLVFDNREVIKNVLLRFFRNYSGLSKITKEMRILIEFGGWTLPEGIDTIRQCLLYLFHLECNEDGDLQTTYVMARETFPLINQL